MKINVVILTYFNLFALIFHVPPNSWASANDNLEGRQILNTSISSLNS